MKFVIELSRSAPGGVTGRIIDTDHDEYTLYEVTILTDSTKDSQTRVLRELARHLDWFVDLSEGGIK